MNKLIIGGLLFFSLGFVSSTVYWVSTHKVVVSQEKVQETLGKPIGMTRVPFCPTPTGECPEDMFEK